MPEITLRPAQDPEADRYPVLRGRHPRPHRHRGRAATLLVLDDLGLGRAATLLLLRHVSAGDLGTPLMIVTCHRIGATAGPDLLTDLRADLRRDVDVVRVELTGVSIDEGSDLMADIRVAH